LDSQENSPATRLPCTDFDQPRPATGHRTRRQPRKLKEKQAVHPANVWHCGCVVLLRPAPCPETGILLALLGAGAGYLLSLAAVRFLEHLLWGVRPTDPLTFVAAAAILLLVASLAPALRILRLDPAQTLRNE